MAVPWAWLGGMLRVSAVSAVCAAGGETEEENIRVDILENQLMDTRMLLATLCYSPDFVSTLTVPGQTKSGSGSQTRAFQSAWSCLLIQFPDTLISQKVSSPARSDPSTSHLYQIKVVGVCTPILEQNVDTQG